jgi:hypothetical protein
VSTSAVTGVTGIALEAAQLVLDGLTGQQFGTCTIKLRPCRQDCMDGSMLALGWPVWPDYWTTYTSGAAWFDAWLAVATCRSCGGPSCSCTFVPELRLPAPVASVLEVKVDGTPLVTGAYRLDSNAILVRTDGHDWPSCNDLTKDDTQVGTWSVTVMVGQEVPKIGQLALGELACEFLRALAGEDCRLPRGVTQLVRQGVTIQLPDISGQFGSGLTGLFTVDLFIRAVNPGKVSARARTYSIDRPRARIIP